MSIRWMYATEHRSIALKGFAFRLILRLLHFLLRILAHKGGRVVRARKLAFC